MWNKSRKPQIYYLTCKPLAFCVSYFSSIRYGPLFIGRLADISYGFEIVDEKRDFTIFHPWTVLYNEHVQFCMIFLHRPIDFWLNIKKDRSSSSYSHNDPLSRNCEMSAEFRYRLYHDGSCLANVLKVLRCCVAIITAFRLRTATNYLLLATRNSVDLKLIWQGMREA